MAIIDLTLPSNTFLSTILFFSYLSTDMEKARSWKKLMINLQENYPQYERAIASATSVAQLESKIWIIDELKLLMENHLTYTDSVVAKKILKDWKRELNLFKKVMPTDYKRVLQEELRKERKAG